MIILIIVQNVEYAGTNYFNVSAYVSWNISKTFDRSIKFENTNQLLSRFVVSSCFAAVVKEYQMWVLK